MPFTGPIQDRLAIRELIDSYADAVNRNDAAAWGALWVEDSVWLLPDYPEWGEKRGRKAIVETWQAAMAHYPGIIFVANPGSIEVDDDIAKARSYTSEVYDQVGATKRDRGVYEDVCVKLDGVWFFKSRSFRNIHRQG